MVPRQRRTASRRNQPQSNAQPEPTPEGVPVTVQESPDVPQEQSVLAGGPHVLEPVLPVPAELANAGITDPLPEHVTQAVMALLQEKNQIIAEREARLSRYEKGSGSARPRASMRGDQHHVRPVRRTPPRRESPPRRSISRRDPPRRTRSHRSPPRRSVRSRRSPHPAYDSVDTNFQPDSDRSSASYSNESTDSRRSRSRSWDSNDSPVANQCRSRPKRPRARTSTNIVPRRPIYERLGPVNSGHHGVPVNIPMPSEIDYDTTGHGPFTREIRRYRIPRDLRKPPNLNKFDGLGDPDKHLRYFNNYCSYRELSSTMKCRLFPQSLDGRALEWWESLRPNSISSWKDLVGTFLANYTANRCHFRYEEHLDTIVQGQNESLRDYITRFNAEADQVRDLSDKDKLKYLKRGIREDHRFAEEFTLNHYSDLGMFLRRANDHMAYEERLAAKKVARAQPKEENNGLDSGHQNNQRRPTTKGDWQNGSHREPRAKRYEQRTRLNTPIAQIFSECQNNEFTNVKRPGPITSKKSRYSKKYCRYHRSKGHDTNECEALKDDIEDLIQKGKLRQYTKTEDGGRPESSNRERPAQDKGKEIVSHTDRHQERSGSEERDNGRPRARGLAMVIHGGNPLDRRESKKATKRKWNELLMVGSTSNPRPASNRPAISFGDEDLFDGRINSYCPLVVSAVMANTDVRRILIDQGSSADIMFEDLIDKLHVDRSDIVPQAEPTPLTGFNGATTYPLGTLELMVTFGDDTGHSKLYRTVRTTFLVLPIKSCYQCIIGRPTLGKLEAVASTVHLKMKFYSRNNQVVTVMGDIEAAMRSHYLYQEICDMEKPADPTTNRPRELGEGHDINVADLDARYDPESDPEVGDDDLARELRNKFERPEPHGELLDVQLGDDPTKTVKLGSDLPEQVKQDLVECLRQYSDLFAWQASDMPGIPIEIACHQLSVDEKFRPVAQRRRSQSQEKAQAAAQAVDDLIKANFVEEIKYTTWLSNVVLVKKKNGKWRMCVDYTDLNKACPKDAFPLPSIDKLVDGAAGYRLLSFLDAYSGYNQITMYPPDRHKTAFMTDRGNFQYKVMPFGLKNAGATYQRMMNKIFRNQIGRNAEVYLDDMIIKSATDSNHLDDLKEVFEEARRNCLRLNPTKCTFGVRAGKFLGFHLTERGIEANPDKCRAVAEMRPPTTKKEIQRLNGMVAALSRFIPKAACKSLPLFRLLKKDAPFEWTDQCQQALDELKLALTNPPIMTKPTQGETLYLYLAITEEVLSAVLVRENDLRQNPVYFISKVLQGPELRYQKIEKIALALLVAARRLRPYFVAHQVVVRTDQPIRQVLHRPDLAGRMIKWAVELSEFGIKFESRSAAKAQILADFIAEMTPVQDDQQTATWTVHVDGSSNSKGSGAGLILENSEGLAIEVSLSFAFHTSNNQAEYEACIAGLQLAREFNVARIELHSDSLLVVSQIQELYDAKDDVLKNYLAKVRELLQQFDRAEVKHVPRTENTRADILSKLASTKAPGNHRSLIQETLTRPSISTKPDKSVAVLSIDQSEDWVSPILKYITTGEEPADPKKARSLRLRATKYSVIEGQLYRRGFSSPLLRCLTSAESDHVLRDIHEGICGSHQGARSIAKRALRAGYFWPTMDEDAKAMVQKCTKCQIHADVHNAPSSELHSLTSPWPFAWWGMDLLGPFQPAPGQFKFLIVAVDYFTKWIEAEPLATITAAKVCKFFGRNVLARFGVPQQLITDNGTQFADKRFKEMLAGLGVKQRFTSVEHPQTNGLAEAANRVLLRGLKRRLDEAKGNWVEELQPVLWAYRTTPHSTTGESPFRLVYGTDAVIPIEVGELSWRTKEPPTAVENDRAIREELDLLEELRTQASLREELIKQKVAARYNAKVQKRDFAIGQLVLRRADVGNKNARQGKLAPNWEGPYRVVSKTGKGAYVLETMEGTTVPRTWNSDKLRKYYV